LSVDTSGTAAPAAKSRRFPATLGIVTVTFTDIALALAGTPH
jgi:hypothetical protein